MLEEKLNKLKMNYLNVHINNKAISLEDNLKLDLLIDYYLKYYNNQLINITSINNKDLINPLINQLEHDILLNYKRDYETFHLDILSLRSFSFLFFNNLFDFSSITNFDKYLVDKNFREILLLESFNDYILSFNMDLNEFLIDYLYNNVYPVNVFQLFCSLSKIDLKYNLGYLNNYSFSSVVLESVDIINLKNDIIKYLLSANDYCRLLLNDVNLVIKYDNIDFIEFQNYINNCNEEFLSFSKGVDNLLENDIPFYFLNLNLLCNSNIPIDYKELFQNLPVNCINTLKNILIKYLK